MCACVFEYMFVYLYVSKLIYVCVRIPAHVWVNKWVTRVCLSKGARVCVCVNLFDIHQGIYVIFLIIFKQWKNKYNSRLMKANWATCLDNILLAVILLTGHLNIKQHLQFAYNRYR